MCCSGRIASGFDLELGNVVEVTRTVDTPKEMRDVSFYQVGPSIGVRDARTRSDLCLVRLVHERV